jgi:outer membrane protein assembly factor BamA
MAGLPFGFMGRFELYRQDTSYLNISWDAGVPYYFNPKTLLTFFIRHRESSILVANELQNSTLQPFSSMLSGLTWDYNSLDNKINPYRGFEFRLEASTGSKTIPDSISMVQSEFKANVSWYQPLAKSLTCAFILQSGYRKSPQTYENEQYRLGGLGLLRGFDEDVFHTNAFAVATVELRYLLDRNSHLVVLSDLGFLKSSDNNAKNPNIPLGLGVGGQIRTGGGIFRIIFAVGKNGNQPFNLRNSKIHLGYIGVF